MTHEPKVNTDHAERDAAWFVLGWKAARRRAGHDDEPVSDIVLALMDEVGERLADYTRPYTAVLRSLLAVSPFSEIDATHEQSLCSWCYSNRAEGHTGDCAWRRAEELLARGHEGVPVSVPVRDADARDSERESGR